MLREKARELAPNKLAHKGQSKMAARENAIGYLFMLPWFIGLLTLTLGPMLASLYLSFTRYDLLSALQWIGLQNFIDIFGDIRFLDALRVTAIYVFLSVPLKLAFALLLALLLNKGLGGLSIYRAVYYVPSLLGGSVAIAILWQQVFGQYGIVNQGLALLGIRNPGSWIASPNTALLTLIILAIWQFGSPMLIFLAGLKQIPKEMYEAASMDGAGKISQFFKITIPLLTPIIFFNLILQMIGAFQAFTPAFIFLNNQSSYTLPVALNAFLDSTGLSQYGTLFAMALLSLIPIFGFFLIFQRLLTEGISTSGLKG
jgi:multiple sugar transport system permease protein